MNPQSSGGITQPGDPLKESRYYTIIKLMYSWVVRELPFDLEVGRVLGQGIAVIPQSYPVEELMVHFLYSYETIIYR